METKFSSGGGGPRRDLSGSWVGSRLPGADQQCHRGRADGPPGSLESRLPQGGPGTQPSRRPPHWGRCRRGRGSCRPMGLAPHKLMLRAGKGPSEARAVGDPEAGPPRARIPRGEGRWARLPRPSPAVLSPSGPEPLGSVHSRACGQHARSLLGDPRGEGTEIGGEEGPQSPWSLLTESSSRPGGHQEGFREVSGVQGVRQRGGLGAPSQWAAGPVGWPRGKVGVWPGVWKRPQLERVSGSCAGVPWVPGHKGQYAVTDAQASPFWGRRSWGPGCAGLTSQLAGPLSHAATVLPALGDCPGTLGGVEAALSPALVIRPCLSWLSG